MQSATLHWLKETRGVFVRPRWEVVFWITLSFAWTAYSLIIAWEANQLWPRIQALDPLGLAVLISLLCALAVDAALILRFALAYEFDGVHIRRLGFFSKPHWEIRVAEITGARLRFHRMIGPYVEVATTGRKRMIEAFPSMREVGLSTRHAA
jgi:hypothetical protein